MAIPWQLNESENVEQSSNNLDVEAAFCKTQNEEDNCTDIVISDSGQQSDSEDDDGFQPPIKDAYGNNNDGDSSICLQSDPHSEGDDDCTETAHPPSGSNTVAEGSTSVAGINCITTGWPEWLKEIIGSLFVGCGSIVLDFSKHSEIFKRFPYLIILVLPLTGQISRFCNSLETRFRRDNPTPTNSNQQPNEFTISKFIHYWAPRFVLHFTGIIILVAIVLIIEIWWNAKSIVSAFNLTLASGAGVLCCYFLMGIAQVVICLPLPFLSLILACQNTQWGSTIWTELSTTPLSYIIAQLIENNGVQWRAWVLFVFFCFFVLYVYCTVITFKNDLLKEIKWGPMLTTFIAQCFTGGLLYEASKLSEDVEILYQIATTVNNYHMTYVSSDIAIILDKRRNKSINRVAQFWKKKGWKMAFKTVVKSTAVYLLILLISYSWQAIFKPEACSMDITFLLLLYLITMFELTCRVFGTFHGILRKEGNENLISWSTCLNVFADVILMLGLRVVLWVLPLDKLYLFQQSSKNTASVES